MASCERPAGREAVMSALTDAAARLIVTRGTHVSVRQIADGAGVNHGLVHTYFGSKEALLAAAFNQINERASTELDEQGFPPADLAERRGGELAKALARMQLDELGNLLSSHPITGSWRSALLADRPELHGDEVDEMVASAATLALGWAVFGDQLCGALGVEAARRPYLDHHVATVVADMGGLPKPVDLEELPNPTE